MQGFGWEFYEDEELNMSNGNRRGQRRDADLAGGWRPGGARLSTALKLTADRIKLPEVRLRAYLEIAQQALQASR
jgi:hypothetical protein